MALTQAGLTYLIVLGWEILKWRHEPCMHRVHGKSRNGHHEPCMPHVHIQDVLALFFTNHEMTPRALHASRSGELLHWLKPE